MGDFDFYMDFPRCLYVVKICRHGRGISMHTVQNYYNKDMIQLHKFFDSTQKSRKVSSSN